MGFSLAAIAAAGWCSCGCIDRPNGSLSWFHTTRQPKKIRIRAPRTTTRRIFGAGRSREQAQPLRRPPPPPTPDGDKKAALLAARYPVLDQSVTSRSSLSSTVGLITRQSAASRWRRILRPRTDGTHQQSRRCSDSGSVSPHRAVKATAFSPRALSIPLDSVRRAQPSINPRW